MYSCINEDRVPEYVIPPEKMVDIIIDIHLTDGVLSVNEVRKKLPRKDSLNYYDVIFENYGYKRSDFDTSIYYYSKNINKFDQIYEEVLNRLNEMETVLKEADTKEEAGEPQTSKDKDTDKE